jgi:hypothetical protein
MLELESRRTYLRVGVFYLILGAPGLVWLATGGLLASRNIYLLTSLLGLPLGALFVLFGTGKFPRNTRSWYAIRVAVLSLFFAGLLLLSLFVVRLGGVMFVTSARFCLMASSYLGLVSLVLGISAALRGKRQ